MPHVLSSQNSIVHQMTFLPHVEYHRAPHCQLILHIAESKTLSQSPCTSPKVTTYAPPFWPPLFRSLENLYSFYPYIWAKMMKMSYFEFLSKFVKMYNFDPLLALCSISSQRAALSLPIWNPTENPPPPHPGKGTVSGFEKRWKLTLTLVTTNAFQFPHYLMQVRSPPIYMLGPANHQNWRPHWQSLKPSGSDCGAV